jgi:MYXO-CTERM domain-containing protein
MLAKRTAHALIALSTGRALAAGGALAVSLGDVAGTESLGTGAWQSIGALSSARREIEGAYLDASRRALVTGGYDSVTKKVLDTSQYFDEAGTTWSSPKKLGEARVFHSLTALPGGNALVVGGLSDVLDPASALRSVELYDGSADAYLPTVPLAAPRFRHTATLLEDGRVLVAGGDGPAGPLKTAELYTPVAQGAACESQAECATGHCVDGVCCESACDDACSACTLANTGKPSGTCALSLAGKDPHADCADDGSPACTKNGLCDGKGACASYAAKPCTPSACTDGDDCASGHCADGICCSAACDGECEACTKTKTGKTDGTCAPVAAGTNPDAECGTLGTGVCRGPSTCGGESECRASTAGNACKPAECQDSVTLAAAATCSTAGECEAETTSCDPYTCNATAVACRTKCAGDSECAEGALCKDGVCERKPDGEACDAANECTSGFCADGVCCNEACEGRCEACDGTNSGGTCRAVSGAPRGDREPCTGEAPCAGTCNGLAAKMCVYPSSETSCGASSCEDGTETRDVCDGRGVCVKGAKKACTPFTCGADSCNTACSSNDDCEGELECSSGRCVVGLPPKCPDGGTSSECTPAAPPADDGGCGCRTPPNSRGPDARLAALGLLALSVFTRRRYRRRRTQ